jgi:hypothetical protein
VFSGCSRLYNLSVKDKNVRYCSKNGCIIERESGTLIAASATAQIPNDGSVKILGQGFAGNKTIESLVIPDSVTEIECNALEGCTMLRNVTLPKHLTSLPSFVFSGCVSLERITAGGDITEIGLFPLDGCEKAVLYAPRGSETAKNAALCDINTIEI